jgi:hypothetical protein
MIRFLGPIPHCCFEITAQLSMTTDDESICNARECVRLAGLTDRQIVREQLLALARGWTAVAQHQRSSDDARVLTFSHATLTVAT